MALEVAPADGVRIATGILLAAFGGWLATRGATSPRAKPLAFFLVVFGLGTAVSNLRLTGVPVLIVQQSINMLLDILALGAVVRLLRIEANEDRRRVSWCAGLGVVAALLGNVPTYLTSAEGYRIASEGSDILLWSGPATYLVFSVLCGLMGAYALVAALRAREAPPEEARALAVIGFAMGVYPLAYFLADTLVLLVVLAAVNATPAFAAIAAWGAARRGSAPAAATGAFVGLLATGLAAILLSLLHRDLGVIGVVRMMMLAAIAYGVFRWGALGAHARPARDRRAALLTSFLVVLLIVAQVAQNFLSSQYSLVMGGIVSGALLVAAKPIERALERRGPAAEAPSPDRSARERSYVAAARKFHKDGVISREEERELMILAEHLGIPPSRAYELRDEVERQRG